ncbi:GNAT family N-acetyltransferase [Streptomyces sp. NBC_01167]|uniref:GNAT family N-acetyltransferase n=1 Tax=Streptomyces sp. NBC_01167 TaxID=2903756 RepID=UPI00386894A0|nr:GNAT family N-acetyltransferase [Streptomyces sp. NBC_01167]
MTTTPALTLRTFDALAPAREDLVAVYSDVRADLLHLPNYAVTAFVERLDRHGSDPGWTAVLAYADDGEPVGYAYSNVIRADDRWWKRFTPFPDPEYIEQPAIALKELGLRVPWRKTGTSLRLHDTLLAAHATEPYVSLMVNPAAGEGKVQRLYESWGYQGIGISQPSPASPVLTAMIRPTRLAEPPT